MVGVERITKVGLLVRPKSQSLPRVFQAGNRGRIRGVPTALVTLDLEVLHRRTMSSRARVRAESVSFVVNPQLNQLQASQSVALARPAPAPIKAPRLPHASGPVFIALGKSRMNCGKEIFPVAGFLHALRIDDEISGVSAGGCKSGGAGGPPFRATTP